MFGGPLTVMRSFGIDEEFGSDLIHPKWQYQLKPRHIRTRKNKLNGQWSESCFASSDIVDQNTKYRIETDMPGIDKSDITITVKSMLRNFRVK